MWVFFFKNESSFTLIHIFNCIFYTHLYKPKLGEIFIIWCKTLVLLFFFQISICRHVTWYRESELMYIYICTFFFLSVWLLRILLVSIDWRQGACVCLKSYTFFSHISFNHFFRNLKAPKFPFWCFAKH